MMWDWRMGNKFVIRQCTVLIIYSVMTLQYSTVLHGNAITECVFYTHYNANETNRVANEMVVNKIKKTLFAYSVWHMAHGTALQTKQKIT